MIHTQEKVFLKDKVATKMFSAPECRDYLLKVISAALGIDFTYLKNNYEPLDIRIGTNINTINSESDIIGKTDQCFISLEINYNRSNRLDNKNMTYICQLVLRQLNKSDQYKKLLPVYQICLNNYDRYGKKDFIYRSSYMEETYHIIRDNSTKIVDIDIDFLTNIEYNEIIKKSDDSLEKLLYIFVCNNENVLDKIYLNNEIIDSVRKKLVNLSKDLDEYLYYDRDEIKRLDAFDLGHEEGIQQGIQQGIEQGIQQGVKQGIEQNAKANAIEMLKLGMSKDTIAKVTKLSIEEINKLKEK